MLQLVDQIKIYETRKVGMLLAFVGGLLEIYTYLLRGGVFANAQTGNMVLLVLNLSSGKWLNAIYYIVPIVAFFIGIVVTELVKLNERWYEYVLMIEIALLFLVGLCPLTVPNVIINSMVSFICAIQFSSFRKIRGEVCATTFCTANLRAVAEQLTLFLVRKNQSAKQKCLNYLMIIFSFCFGALIGAIFIKWIGIHVIWICCFVLICVVLMIRREGKSS